MNVRVLVAAVAVVAASFLAAGTLPVPSAGGAPSTYEIDGDHSFGLYRIRIMNIGYSYGRFNEISGAVTLDDDPAKCSISVKVNPATIDTGNKKRDEHLKSPDFFNVAQFPDMSFASTAVKKVDDTHYDVTGDLTMHGVSKPVTIRMEKGGPIKDHWDMQRVAFNGTVTIQRSLWSVGKVNPGENDDDVLLTIAIQARK